MTKDTKFRKKENERIDAPRKKRYAEDIETARAKSRETSRKYREKKKQAKQQEKSEMNVVYDSLLCVSPSSDTHNVMCVTGYFLKFSEKLLKKSFCYD